MDNTGELVFGQDIMVLSHNVKFHKNLDQKWSRDKRLNSINTQNDAKFKKSQAEEM